MDDRNVSLIRLVHAAQTRDHEAFLSLMETLHPRLSARARSYFDDPSLAEDALQETYLRAYENLSTLKDSAAVLSWTLTILDRVAQRLSTKYSAEQALPEMPGRECEAPVSPALLEIGDTNAAADELRQALARVPQADREFLMLRFGAGFNAIQIAAQTNSTPAAVRMRLSRIVARLREIMGVRR
jgi:RNA polymerase sigma-70 factor (ECF subfamily)